MSEDYRFEKESYLLIGKVSKAHGLNGEVKLVSFSGQPERLAEYREVILVSQAGRLSRPLKLISSRTQGNAGIVSFDSVTTRGEAEKIEGLGVLVNKDTLPALNEDEFYWHQYEGKKVFDRDDNYIGLVTSLFSGGAQDILVINGGETEILVPVTKEIVIRETADSLIIDPPPGLLDINSGDEQL